MKAAGPVTGYKVYCFHGDSQKAEIVQDITDMNDISAIISGLKPENIYRVGITCVSSGSESKIVFSKDEVILRKSHHDNVTFVQA